MGFVDLLYTAFLMPVLIVFPTNNTMYYWGSAVNLVLGGQSAVLLCVASLRPVLSSVLQGLV